VNHEAQTKEPNRLKSIKGERKLENDDSVKVIDGAKAYLEFGSLSNLSIEPEPTPTP
jgi:hypothetical protein